METEITVETTFIAEVEDRPGVLAEATSLLAREGINLSLLAGWPAGPGRARLCCIPDDPEKLRQVAAAHGIPLEEQIVFIVRGDDQVGALVDVSRSLGAAGVNIRDMSALSVDNKFATVIAVGPEDVTRAAKALGMRSRA